MGTAIMQSLAQINEKINAIVWGVPFLIFIIGTGIWLTVRTGFFQIVRAKFIARKTILAIFRNREVTKSKDDKAISQFQALSTALAASLGTGNIAGVAAAVAVGGPGAVFWMWISALFGMMTKFAEAALAVYYRRRNDDGEWSGGAMYYLREGLKDRKGIGFLSKPLAALFALFCALAAFGIGNMTQVNSIASAMEEAFNLPPLMTGIALAIAAALVIIKGIKGIGTVTEKLVPFMALFYIVATLAIFIMNASQIPRVFSSIFGGAFSVRAIAGGVGGVGLMRAATWGFKRGVFSNEAGLGSAAMAHAAADVKEPVQQGMWGIFEVFIDTIVVCTLTAFALLSATTGAPTISEAIKNVTTDAQYVRIIGAEADYYGREIPLIDAGYNRVLLSPVALHEAGTAVTAMDEGDFIYTNVMTMRGIARTDEAGNSVIDSVAFEKVTGVPLVTYAVAQRFGDVAGKLLSIAVLLFAFATVLGWSYYGSKAAEYLLGTRVTLYYKILFVAFIVVGATMSLDLAWGVADTLNGLMALPNLVGLMALSGVVMRLTRNYTARNITKREPDLEPMLSAYPEIQEAQAARGDEA